MTVIAVTGHMDLTEQSIALVREALETLLATHTDDGLTYRQSKVKPDYEAEFDRLHQAAAGVVVMPHAEANREAYEAANDELVRRADHLFAVWDGQPGNGRGGTADTVAAAQAVSLPVTVVWPDGATRQSY